MENSIIPTAAQIRNDYLNGVELQKSIAKTIKDAASEGHDHIAIKLTPKQTSFICPILKELGYLTLPYPVRYNDNSIAEYLLLEISW